MEGTNKPGEARKWLSWRSWQTQSWVRDYMRWRFQGRNFLIKLANTEDVNPWIRPTGHSLQQMRIERGRKEKNRILTPWASFLNSKGKKHPEATEEIWPPSIKPGRVNHPVGLKTIWRDEGGMRGCSSMREPQTPRDGHQTGQDQEQKA